MPQAKRTNSTSSKNPWRPTDTVEHIGREIGQVWDAIDRAQAVQFALKDNPEAGAAMSAEKTLQTRLRQLESSLPALRAKGVAGAIIMVIHAARVAADIEANAPGEGDEEAFKDAELWRSVARWHEDLESLLYSAAEALRTEAPDVFKACAGPLYLPERLSPFAAVDQPLPDTKAA